MDGSSPKCIPPGLNLKHFEVVLVPMLELHPVIFHNILNGTLARKESLFVLTLWRGRWWWKLRSFNFRVA